MPLFASIKQRIGNGLLIDRLKKTKHPAIFFVVFIMSVINDRGDSPYHFATAHRQERLAFRILVEWMGLVVQKLLLIAYQRRNPIRIIGVVIKRKSDELFLLSF